MGLLLSVGGVQASQEPPRPLCRAINATLAAEKEACPVCITFTASICAGYCPSMVSWPESRRCHLGARVTPQGLAHRGPVAAGWKCGLPHPVPGQVVGNWS